MEADTFVITIGVSNLLALGGLIFRAGGIASTVSRHDNHVNTLSTDIRLMTDKLNIIGQRVAHLEGVIRKRRSEDTVMEGM